MELYAKSTGVLKKLKKSLQGYADAVADIERLARACDAKCDANSPRTKYEKGVLCQADNNRESWLCSGRFVWAVDSTGTKALLVGYVPEHVGGKWAAEYDKLKISASKVSDAEIVSGMPVPSSQTIREEEKIRREAESFAEKGTTKREEEDWKPFLSRIHAELYSSCSTEQIAKDNFIDCVKVYLKEHPELTDPVTGVMTNKELSKLKSNGSFNVVFKRDMAEAQICMKNEYKERQQADNSSPSLEPFPLSDMPSMSGNGGR